MSCEETDRSVKEAYSLYKKTSLKSSRQVAERQQAREQLVLKLLEQSRLLKERRVQARMKQKKRIMEQEQQLVQQQQDSYQQSDEDQTTAFHSSNNNAATTNNSSNKGRSNKIPKPSERAANRPKKNIK